MDDDEGAFMLDVVEVVTLQLAAAAVPELGSKNEDSLRIFSLMANFRNHSRNC